MNGGLSSIKNIIWGLAIVVALFALLVGLVFSVSNSFVGIREEATLNVKGEGITDSDQTQQVAETDIIGAAPSGLNILPSTQDAGLEYLFNLSFLCDSTIAGVKDYSSSFGSTATVQVWTDSGTGFPAATASECSIVNPADGSTLTPANATMIYQPKRLIIYIGGDDLASATEDSFVSGYTELIQGIRKSSPATTTIVCCSIASVSAAYPGADGLTAELTAQANQWIMSVCTATGAYYADLASVFNDDSGYLAAEYASTDGRSLNSAGIAKLMEYFRMHGV